MGIKVTRIATSGQALTGGSTLDATYSGTDVDVTTGLPLDGLLDVNAPAPDDNDVLTWDDAASEWIAAPGGGSGLDVVLSTVAATGATETVDVSVARTADLTLTADCTLTLTGAVTAEAWYLTLFLRQDGTGGWDVVWPGSVEWASGSAPTIDPAINSVTVVTLVTLDGGTVWFGFPTGGGGVGVADIVDIPTAETDTALVLHPDGTGGVEWGADATGGGGAIVPPVIQTVTAYQGGSTTNALTVAVATRALVAIVSSETRGATSITQTNVTWTRRYTGNAGGVYVEVWTGAIAGTTGTTVTFNFDSGTKSLCIFVELDVAALTSVGTATTATNGLLSFSGETTGDLCVFAETSFNGNTGYVLANMPYAPLMWGGCLHSGFFYFAKVYSNVSVFQSGSATRFAAIMRIS